MNRCEAGAANAVPGTGCGVRMSASSDSVRVTIYGDEYSIKGDVDGQTTKKVAEYVNKTMEEIQAGIKSKDKLKIAVLSALNIAGECIDYKAKYEELQKRIDDVQERLNRLSKRIDENVPVLP